MERIRSEREKLEAERIKIEREKLEAETKRLREEQEESFSQTEFENEELDEETKSVVVTADMVARLQAEMQRKQSWRPAEGSVQPLVLNFTEVIDKTLKVMGRTPKSLAKIALITREVEALERTLTSERLQAWDELGEEANFALTAWITARARAIQAVITTKIEEIKANSSIPSLDDPHFLLMDRVKRFFPRISRHSNLTRPGMIYGLARSHNAPNGSWLEEAQRREKKAYELIEGSEKENSTNDHATQDDVLRRMAIAIRDGIEADEFREYVRSVLKLGVPEFETRLVNMSLPFINELDFPEFLGLQKIVKRMLKDDVDDDNGKTNIIPEDWPCFEYTRDRIGVIVGGDPRHDRREHLQKAFQFRELEWLPNPKNGNRHIDSLTQRMKNGTIDVIIVLRAFSSHKISDKVFHAVDTDCLRILSDSYGLKQVRLAIEKHCDPNRK